MRGSLETIVGAMFAGKTSELLKRILWAKHQNKNIVVIKPSLDNRYSESKIITHNDLSHECFAMQHWGGMEATKTYRKEEGGGRTQVGAANIYEPRCLKHWTAR